MGSAKPPQMQHAFLKGPMKTDPFRPQTRRCRQIVLINAMIAKGVASVTVRMVYDIRNRS